MIGIPKFRRPLGLAVAAAAVAIPAAPALAQDDLTITAPRVIQRSTATGAPIELVTITRTVSLRGLNPKQIEGKINEAAVSACREMDTMHPVGTPEFDGCVKDSVRRAKALAMPR